MDLTKLQAEIAETKGTIASAIVLIQGFAAFVEANQNDPAALQAYVDELHATEQGLADAVAANPLPAQG